jgi:hypothetical protein
MTPSRTFSDSGLIGSGSFGIGSPVPYPSEELLGDPMDDTISSERDSISVTVRFRPLSDREYQRGDEVAWYPDGDTLVRHEYNPLTAYAFDKVFGPQATTIDVYDVAARPVVKAAMEGVNGTVFAYGVTSSGKTHTMHVRVLKKKNPYTPFSLVFLQNTCAMNWDLFFNLVPLWYLLVILGYSKHLHGSKRYHTNTNLPSLIGDGYVSWKSSYEWNLKVFI